MTTDPSLDPPEGIVEELRDEVHGFRAEVNLRIESLWSEMNSRFNTLLMVTLVL